MLVPVCHGWSCWCCRHIGLAEWLCIRLRNFSRLTSGKRRSPGRVAGPKVD